MNAYTDIFDYVESSDSFSRKEIALAVLAQLKGKVDECFIREMFYKEYRQEAENDLFNRNHIEILEEYGDLFGIEGLRDVLMERQYGDDYGNEG